MAAADRYGHNIMVLSPIRTLEYIVSEKEVIGDAFNAKLHGTLNDEQTWYKLRDILGDKVFDEMPKHVLDRFDGAEVAYWKYINNKNGRLPDNREVISNFSEEKNILERIISAFNRYLKRK